MASIIAWFTANWQPLMLALIAIDQVLVAIFPSVPFLNQLLGWLKGASGTPQLK